MNKSGVLLVSKSREHGKRKSRLTQAIHSNSALFRRYSAGFSSAMLHSLVAHVTEDCEAVPGVPAGHGDDI